MATKRGSSGTTARRTTAASARPTRPGLSGDKATRRQAASRALAAARGGKAARRRLWLTVGGPIALVLVLVAVLVVVKVTSGAGSPESGEAAGLAPASLTSKLAAVPANTLDTIGAGSAGQKPFTALPTRINGAALTRDGLPRILYVGADYCPFCAAERWAIVVALSRFGSFEHLGTTSSSPSDVYPNTPTLSFHRASFSSSMLAFDGYELYSNQARSDRYAALDRLGSTDEALFASSGGSFPYLNIGGRYVLSGASFSPQLLSGLTRSQIAAALSDANSPIAKAVDGTANVITAAICEATAQQPATVCTAPGMVAARAALHQ